MERREEMLAEVWRPVYRGARDRGMSEEAAFQYCVGRGDEVGVIDEADGFDRSVAIFRSLGLSESAARDAVVGRDGTEAETRRAYTEVLPSLGNIGPAVKVAIEAGLAPRIALTTALAAGYEAQGCESKRAMELAAGDVVSAEAGGSTAAMRQLVEAAGREKS